MSAEASEVSRWKVTCSYDGTNFDGWQSQASGNGVQDHCEKAVASISGGFVRLHGAGRTDAGVHARGQVFHMDLAWRHGGEALGRALATVIPPDIQIRRVEQVDPHFHARFDGRGKRYIYRFELGVPDPMERRFVYPVRSAPVSLAAMRAAATRLQGEHDFSSFAVRIDERENRVKHVWRVEVVEQSPTRVDLVVEGNGFLYRMVRRMAGAVLQAGLGRLTADEISMILGAAQTGAEIPTAPAAGLCLEEVFYPGPCNDRS